MMNEYFKELKGFEGLYVISNYGTIASNDKIVKNRSGFRKVKGKTLKPKIDKYGYFRIGLTKDGNQKYYFVHRLVAETFIPNINNYPIINHKDGNKKNNYINNLEWCTQSENVKHAYNTGLKIGKGAKHKGASNPNVKLSETDVLKIIRDKKNNINIKESYLKYKEKISFKGFEQIWYGYTWKHFVEKVGDDQ